MTSALYLLCHPIQCFNLMLHNSHKRSWVVKHKSQYPLFVFTLSHSSFFWEYDSLPPKVGTALALEAWWCLTKSPFSSVHFNINTKWWGRRTSNQIVIRNKLTNPRCSDRNRKILPRIQHQKILRKKNGGSFQKQIHRAGRLIGHRWN